MQYDMASDVRNIKEDQPGPKEKFNINIINIGAKGCLASITTDDNYDHKINRQYRATQSSVCGSSDRPESSLRAATKSWGYGVPLCVMLPSLWMGVSLKFSPQRESLEKLFNGVLSARTFRNRVTGVLNLLQWWATESHPAKVPPQERI